MSLRRSVCADPKVISLYQIIVAAEQEDSRVIAEVTNGEATHRAAAGFDGQAISVGVGYRQSIDLDEGCAGVSWLSRRIDNHRVRNFRKCIHKSNRLHSWSGNVEDDRVFTDIGVRVNDCFAQRSGTVIVCVRHHKILSRGGEVGRLIRAQGVKGLTGWTKSETKYRGCNGVVTAIGEFK